MKLFVFLLVAICFSAVFADDDADWLAFKMQHGKMFLSPGKEATRKATFIQHKATINQLQAAADAGEISYTPAMYSWHDLPHEEIMARKTGLQKPAETRNHKVVQVVSRQSPPENYDSRNVIPFNPPKDQGQCGSCWTFSSINAIEGTYATDLHALVSLSEQQLVDCGYGRDGCRGGWMPDAFNYLQSVVGPVSEDEYPYIAVYGQCYSGAPMVVLSGYVKIDTDPTSIKNAVMKYGSLAICVDASNWSYYGGGIFEAESIRAVTNHAVNLIGWGYDDTLGQEYWLIRNSWGAYWGEEGTIRVATTKLGTYNPDETFGVTLAT